MFGHHTVNGRGPTPTVMSDSKPFAHLAGLADRRLAVSENSGKTPFLSSTAKIRIWYFILLEVELARRGSCRTTGLLYLAQAV
jgi:hypothetical protein